MMGCKFLKINAFIALAIFIIGCANVKYVGKSYNPTTNIDVYYSEKDIEKEYEVIGHVVGRGGFFVSDDQIHKKLIEEAKQKGADAIVITGIDVEHVSSGDVDSEERQIEATFIKYKSVTEEAPD